MNSRKISRRENKFQEVPGVVATLQRLLEGGAYLRLGVVEEIRQCM